MLLQRGPLSLAKGHLTGAESIWKEGMEREERHVVLFHTQMPGHYEHTGIVSFKLYLIGMHIYPNVQ